MKHLTRAAASAVILALTAFGLSACGSTGDDDCDETSVATAQLAMVSGSKPKPPKLTKPKASKPKIGTPGGKSRKSTSKNGKHKGSKPKVGSHHDDDFCDED
ncbi:hypothetical protein [Streptomyces sp. AC1-42T]|uniref:hypothetical protein n=1 Tax=Streptomyces sp. AC1-42T TaxID=2218665 RepID=UPI000DACBDFD|nr:hypothetical protein [Streptomyces sp. AC1-42T]PZT71408.1 hypothetical protein DNK55_32360 [Streptomyces sp. AC1-42T]